MNGTTGNMDWTYFSGEWNGFWTLSSLKIMIRLIRWCNTTEIPWVHGQWVWPPEPSAHQPGRHFHAYVGGGRRDAQDSRRLAKARVCGCTCVGHFGRRQGSTREAVFALLAAHDPVGVKGFRFVCGNKRQQTWLTFDNQIINLTFTES